MKNFIDLPDSILLNIISKISIGDLIAVADSHSKLGDFIYTNSEIWTNKVLFPAGDTDINDKLIQRLMPRMARNYKTTSLNMLDLLELSWTGYFFIFDQFGHSVKTIEIRTTKKILSELVHHLTIFAGNLTLLQRDNQIPITFRQYVFDDEKEFENALMGSNYLGQHSVMNLIGFFTQIQLDDPPFERLEKLNVNLLDEPNETQLIQQLELLTNYLSGKQPLSKKRPREEYHPPQQKYMKHDVIHTTSLKFRSNNYFTK